jgi:hypothetical protein
VRADRSAFLAWAQTRGLHPAVVALAQAHERILDDVPPRTWAYVSEVLTALRPEDLADGALLRDALGGYLPPAWVEALLAGKDTWSSRLKLDVRALLSSFAPGTPQAAEIAGYRKRGQTDRLDEITERLSRLLSGPEAGVLVAERQISLSAFEALCAELPGDHRERLQEALGQNPTAASLVDLAPTSLLQGYPGSAAEQQILAWRADPLLHHRLALAVTALRAYLSHKDRAADLKKSNAVRTCLGQLLTQLPERQALGLVETLKKLGITPIRPQ